ncbi:hypothetical protein AGMMS49928_28360 [Spirochaetia bacterium]|nr:hypothetical protein AGMMS49928_28360 [Spirochaetia bacterium]
MRNFRLYRILPGILALTLLMGGCAKPPAEEMEAAKLAVTRAENDADARAYASASLVRARDALNRMQSEADSKKYDSAKTLAAEAVSAAEKAISDGKAGAAQARQEASRLVDGLRGPLADTENTIKAAKQVKNLNLDFDGIDRDFDGAKRTAGEAQASLTANNYKDASDKAQSVRSTLGGINGRIADATQTLSKKK